MAFGVRGVVEGFYGAPWTHDQRLHMLEFLGSHSMNAYMYAPKDDALHRDKWRVPYDGEMLEQFRELAEVGKRCNVRVGFAISPGLDIAYSDESDRAALLAKCAAMLRCGIDWFLLALDDIPMSDGLAHNQAALANWLLHELTTAQPSATLMLCPTEYLGVQAGSYTRELAAELDTAIALMWTGPTVCSPTITSADAGTWRSAFANHELVVWDNYPVNDGAMASRLHLGAYDGRSADLDSVVQGVLLNPMNQPFASKVALATAAEYCSDPTAYQAHAAWIRVVDSIGVDEASRAAFASLCRACADGPTAAPETLALAELVRDLQAAHGSPNFATMLDDADAELRTARAAANTLLDAAAGNLLDPDFGGLASEIQPWAERLRAEARAGLAAIKVIRCADASPFDPLALMGATFGLSFHWTEARRSEHVVFGPRFATYPAIVMHTSGQPVFDAAMGIFEDRNAVDALCRFAMQRNDEAIAA